MTDAQQTILGERIVALFNLKADKKGLYATDWGTKTLAGIGACVDRIVTESSDNKVLTAAL